MEQVFQLSKSFFAPFIVVRCLFVISVRFVRLFQSHEDESKIYIEQYIQIVGVLIQGVYLFGYDLYVCKRGASKHVRDGSAGIAFSGKGKFSAKIFKGFDRPYRARRYIRPCASIYAHSSNSGKDRRYVTMQMSKPQSRMRGYCVYSL